jgi:phosphate transport system permease protein
MVVVILAILMIAILLSGLPQLDGSFLVSPPSKDAGKAGIRPALFGTIWVCGVCALSALPIGVATAILLEEFPPCQRVLRAFHSFVQLNISNLAGVPSVVYGIIGLTTFANFFGLFGTPNNPAFEMGVLYYDQFLTEGDRIVLVPRASATEPMAEVQLGMTAYSAQRERVEVNVIGSKDPLPRDEQLRQYTLRSDAEGGRISKQAWYFFRIPLGRGVLAGGLTLMLVILPIVIIASQEALRAVPDSLREGSFGMGATRWQTVWNITLPAAIPGIMTGSILAMSRAIGEAAPILIICGIVYIASNPGNLMDAFTVMPLQIYEWAKRPQAEFHKVAASGIVVLLTVLLSFNALAVFVRQRYQKRLS